MKIKNRIPKYAKYAMVVQILGRMGNKGQAIKIRVRLLKNDKILLTRCIKGCIRLGDIIILNETDRDVI